MPKLRITVAEPPEAFDDLSVPLAGEYDDQHLDPHSLVVTGPFDGSPRLSGVEVGRGAVATEAGRRHLCRSGARLRRRGRSHRDGRGRATTLHRNGLPAAVRSQRLRLARVRVWHTL